MRYKLASSLVAAACLASAACADDVGWDGTTYYRTTPSEGFDITGPALKAGQELAAPVQTAKPKTIQSKQMKKTSTRYTYTATYRYEKSLGKQSDKPRN